MMQRFLLVSVVMFTTGCVATRTDVLSLRSDIGALRAERIQSDSAIRVQLERVILEMRHASDSLNAITARLSKYRGETQTAMSGIQQQLLQVQELTGQSERRLQEVRASLEERAQAIAVASGDSAAAGGAAGPNQLFQIARDQLVRGSHAAARTAFQDLLSRYPSSSLAADAEYYVGESYAGEGNVAAADSVYARVASTYPSSPRAATALYKRGISAQGAGRTRVAEQLFAELIRRFPASDEAALARERTRTPR